MADERVDLIVVGGGKGGKTLAMAYASAGHKVVMIERAMVGGSCINVACIPTKTMVGSAKVMEMARRAKEYGIKIDHPFAEISSVIDHKSSVVHTMREMVRSQFLSTSGLEFLMGEARFIGPKRVEVALQEGGVRQFSADRIVVNTGTQPAIPPIQGLKESNPLTSISLLEIDHLPKHLVIMGGGYVGCEFAQIFRRFGSEVTVIQHGGHLLSKEDEDVAAEVANLLKAEGITIYLNSAVQKVAGKSGNEIKVTLSGAQGTKEVVGSHLLVAIGRASNSEGLNLAATGVALDKRGFIPVNEKLETNIPGIYAIGDANGGPQFTHVSLDDYRVVRSQLMEKGERTTHNRLIPYTVFLDPELGRVGLTEKEARQRGLKYRLFKVPAAVIPRARTLGETKGMLKALVDEATGEVLGCAILAAEGGEVMGAIQVAMLGKLHYTALRDGIFAHPTLVESLNYLFA